MQADSVTARLSVRRTPGPVVIGFIGVELGTTPRPRVCWGGRNREGII